MNSFMGNTGTGLLAVFLAILAILAAYFKWAFLYWKRRGVQTPVPTIPLGNTTQLFAKTASFAEILRNIYEEFRAKGLRYCGFYFLTRPTLLLFDPDLIRNVMTKDFQHFMDHGNYVNEEVDPLSGHLFNLKGAKWKNLRAKLTPTFTSGKMKMMFQTLADCSEGLVAVMDKKAEDCEDVDIKDVVGRFTTDVIGSCAFGIECNSLHNPSSEFRVYGKRVFEVLNPVQALKMFLSISFPEVLQFLNLPVFRKDVTNFFLGIVNQTVAYREKNNMVRKDFMHLLIQLKNNVAIRDEEELSLLKNDTATDSRPESDGTFGMGQLAAQAFVFFLGGFETSSTTLTFCMYEMACNTEIQEKLRKEVNDVLAKHGGKVTYDALMQMAYMDKCIHETLRKYPVVPVLTRKCTKPYKVPESELVVEKGTLVYLPLLGIQHDPQHYPNPKKFYPERFSVEGRSSRHPFTWLPFGEGPRGCIGFRFGMMQMKVALTVLLKNYRFHLSPKTETPLAFDPKAVIMSVKGGIWLTIEKISSLD